MRARSAAKRFGADDYGIYFLLAAVLIFCFGYFWLPRGFTATAQEMAVSLVFFAAASYMSGYSLTKDVYKPKDRVECAAMRTGFGLAALPVLFTVMESAHVPLRWYIILALSAVRPVYDILMSEYRLPKAEILRLASYKPGTYSALAVLLGAVAFTLALYGSFTYAYLEDSAPWEHAAGAKYVSVFGTYTPPEGVFVSQYLRPYPPAYDSLMGVIHQLNSSVSWTLKSFNSLLVGLTYVLAYFFVKKASGDEKTAMYSVAVLFMLPPFGSHAIWARTLSVLLLFPAFYAADSIRENKSWAALASIFLASSLLVEPLMSAVIVLFYAMFAASRAYANGGELKRLLAVGAAAVALSTIYWGPVVLYERGQGSLLGGIEKAFRIGGANGAADPAAYPTWSQVFFPKAGGDIFMQPGFGVFAVILAVLCLDRILRADPMGLLKKEPWTGTVAMWLILSFAALMSSRTNVYFDSASLWGVAAIPLAVVCGLMIARIMQANPAIFAVALGALVVLTYAQNYPLDSKAVSGSSGGTVTILLWLVSAAVVVIVCAAATGYGGRQTRWLRDEAPAYLPYLILAGMLFSAGYPKMLLQTSVWPSELISRVGAEYVDYYTLKGLPANTPVYTFCLPDRFVIGMDKMGFPWDPEIADSRGSLLNQDPRKMHTLIRSRGYEWAMFDASCIVMCAKEGNMSARECVVNYAQKMKSLEDSALFTMTWHSNSTMIYHVN